MKLAYITAKQYPSSTADHHYVENLAKAFHSQLGNDFSFIINLRIPPFLKRTLFFFFWIPLYWLKNNKKETVFFSNDQNLLVLLIFWKKLFFLNYQVSADWHMLSGTWKDRFIARYAGYSFSTSKKLENAVRKIFPFANIHTTYGGVDLHPYSITTDKISLRKELGLPADKFLAGYVGLFMTMGMEKGISMMINTLPNLPSDYIMVFVGGKSEEIKHYEEIARVLGVLERCFFVPMQNFANVIKYEKTMDALIIPYPDKPHFRSYGFPMKIYEYMASGVPIIYTKLELLEEVVGDCAYGIMPDSPHKLAEKIKEIHSNLSGAKQLAVKALDKVQDYTWDKRAKNILERFAIMPFMLNISNKALKYILFQRTEFSIYAKWRWMLRMVMNKKIPIYNAAVNLEATIFPHRTRRLFSLDMDREYSIIKKHLSADPKNILDIGCGVAGIDIMLYKHYESKEKFPNLYLLDKSEVNSKVYYGIEKEAAYYNSLGVAKALLRENGVDESHIHLQEVTGEPIFPGKKFDLIISLISWGFHYPISTYLDYAYESLSLGGTLIVDIRNGTDGETLLREKFGKIEIIYEGKKHRRILAYKK